MKVKTISMGCDHGGYELKEALKKYLTDKGYEIKDRGCFSKDSVDYPVFARAAAEDVANKVSDRGIVICTTGIGVSITANKVKGVRCALCHNEHTARMTRLHNDSNVLALGAAEVSVQMAEMIADIFLETEFSGEERHARRIKLIEG
ncbi:MAG: ribose 5-phosphate isomerase B [Lachnospiraceae bacterium]|nr:ribose 5-phosphate isomerase B [Lachnospiraceae bacterium]